MRVVTSQSVAAAAAGCWQWDVPCRDRHNRLETVCVFWCTKRAGQSLVSGQVSWRGHSALQVTQHVVGRRGRGATVHSHERNLSWRIAGELRPLATLRLCPSPLASSPSLTFGWRWHGQREELFDLLSVA